MIKFFKKHKLKIFTAMFCAFALSLFTIISFGCKTYAYTIDGNGNLVGDNLVNLPNVAETTTSSGLTYEIKDNIAYYKGGVSPYNWYAVTNTNITDIFVSGVTYTIHTFKDGFNNYNLQMYFQIIVNNQNVAENNYTFTYTNQTVYIQLKFGDISRFNVTDRFQLKLMINEGNTPKSWEPYGVWYSQNNYTNMENYYNDLLGNNPNVLYNALYGQNCLLVDSNNYNRVFAQDIMFPSNDVKTFSEISLPNIFNYLNNYDSEDTSTYPTPYMAYIINFNFQITNPLMFEYGNTVLDVNFTFKNTIANNELTEQRDNTYPYFSIQNKEKFTYNQLIYDGIYMPDYATIDFNLSIDGVAYANGYQDGINSQQTYISILRNDINSLNNRINELSNTINTLKALNDDLQQHSDVGWQSLFFAMADTPIRVVSNVLGFELFGLNLFSTFIGMVTVFAIVWLLKKFI